MEKLKIFLSALLVSLTMVGCQSPQAVLPTMTSAFTTPDYVVIEPMEPAFTVFTAIPRDIEHTKLEEIRLKASKTDKAELIRWDQLKAALEKYSRLTVKRNDYPNFKVLDGLMCLVKKSPGAPWGLTWNGGIALTRNDYNHARRTYESYKTNPDSYKPIRDSRSDPVNPGGHLPAFGCFY